MEYKENLLSYEDYCILRESVDWKLFSEEQMKNALNNSLYTITAIENNRAVGMGRLIGDEMYFIIADIVVHPAFQKHKIGTNIMNMLLKYIEKKAPEGWLSIVWLIAEKGKEPFYEKFGFKTIPHEFSGSGMRKVIRR